MEPLPPPEQLQEQPPPRARTPRLLVIIAVVVLFAVGGIGFGLGRASVDWGTPDAFTVSGSMTVDGSCGSGGYSDIRDGAQVEIVNQDNKVLGVSTLQTSNERCHFTFTVRGIPTGERLYGASTGNANRGVIWKTEQEAKSDGFHLTLG